MSGGIATAVESLAARLRPADDTAHCPVDDWTFTPRYTDGSCPLCGYRPPGMPVVPPWSARIDWFWPTAIAFALISVVMGILVIVAYYR